MEMGDPDAANEKFVEHAIEAGVIGFVPITKQRKEMEIALRSFFDEDEKWHILVHDLPGSEGYDLLFVYHEDFPEHGFGLSVTDKFYPERFIANMIIHFKSVMADIRNAALQQMLSFLPNTSVEEGEENNDTEEDPTFNYTH